MSILLYVFLLASLALAEGNRLFRSKEPPGSTIHSWICEDECCAAVPACNVTSAPTKARSLTACLQSLRDDCTVTINGTYALTAENHVCVGSRTFGFDFSFLEGEKARFLSDLHLNHVGLILNYAGGGTFTKFVRNVPCKSGETHPVNDWSNPCVYIDGNGNQMSDDEVRKWKASQPASQYYADETQLDDLFVDFKMANQQQDHPHNHERARMESQAYFRAAADDQYLNDRAHKGSSAVTPTAKVDKSSEQAGAKKKIKTATTASTTLRGSNMTSTTTTLTEGRRYNSDEIIQEGGDRVERGDRVDRNQHSFDRNQHSFDRNQRRRLQFVIGGTREVQYAEEYWADFTGHGHRKRFTLPAIVWASMNEEAYTYVNGGVKDKFTGEGAFVSNFSSSGWAAGSAGRVVFPRAGGGDGKLMVDSRIMYYPARVWQAQTLTHGCTGMMTYGNPVSVMLRQWAHNFGYLGPVANDALNPIYVVIPTQYTPLEVKENPVWLFEVNTRPDQQAHLQRWSTPIPFVHVSIESQKRGLLKPEMP